jgi:hypothetical protein
MTCRLPAARDVERLPEGEGHVCRRALGRQAGASFAV